MVLVERDDAWRTLDGLLTDCSTGKGRVVLIDGGLACGKTELCHAFCDHVVAAGARLVCAMSAPEETLLRLGVLRQALHSTALPPGLADRVARVLAANVARDGDEPLTTDDTLVVQEVCAILLALAADRPLVLVIEDIQFADRLSLQVVLTLLRRIRSERVLVVLTEWKWPRPTQSLLHAELTRRRCHRIHLGPLSERGVARLVDRRPTRAGAGFASACYRLTGGNPLLVHALIDDSEAAARGGTVTEPVVGVAYGHAVLACLHRWQSRLLDVAQGLAMLGDAASDALIARLIDVPLDSVQQVVDILSAAGLVRSGRFRHPVVGGVVLDSMADDARSRLRLRVAELLHQRGAATTDITAHLVAADRAPGGWAVRVLRESAEQALADDDVDRVVRCLKLALRSEDGLDRKEMVAMRRMLATAEWRISPAAADADLAVLHTEADAGRLSAADATGLLRHLLWHGEIDEATRHFAELADTMDARSAAEVRLVAQWLYGSSRTMPAPPRPAPAQGGDDPWTLAATTLDAMLRNGADAPAVARAEHILRSYHLGDSTLEVLATTLFALSHANRTGLAASWCDALLAEAMRRNAPTWRAVLGSVRADIALRQGDLVVAQELATAALTELPVPAWGVLIGFPLATLVHTDTALGRHDAARERLRQIVPDAMFQTVFGVYYLYARGHHELAADRVFAALDDFQTCGRLLREWQLDIPALIPWRTGLAGAHVRLGHIATAAELAEEQLELLGVKDGRTKGLTLRVLAKTRMLTKRPCLLRKAIDALDSAGDRLELARTLADLGESYRELGQFGQARVVMRRANQEARACHPGLPAGELRTGGTERSRDTDPVPDGVPVLSTAERRVATLAALGHTNREIGDRLYITVSTVEQHLTRVYRKLDVNNRAGLSTVLSAYRGN